MLKRKIDYEDFNGEPASDICYFNISKPELLELEVEYDGGFTKMIQNVIDAKDHKTLIQHFKSIILMAYGKKSDDGKTFLKNDAIREEFAHSAAYISLFMELASDDDKAATFLMGVLPKDMVAEVSKQLTTSAPQPPTT